MKISGGVIGVDRILRNMQGGRRLIGIGVARGLKKSGLMLQREAQEKVPVNFGVLKASAFTRAQGVGIKTVVHVGFTAAYALFVHENREIYPPGMRLKGQPRKAPGKGFYWDPQGKAQPKFLEEPFRAFGPKLLATVKAEILKVTRGR